MRFAEKKSRVAIHLLDATLGKVFKCLGFCILIGKAGKIKCTSQGWRDSNYHL